VTVLSAYSRPKIQLVTNPKTKVPPTAIICACKLIYDGQLASPAIWALAPINPAFLASSGFFNTNMKNPAMNGAIVNAAAVSHMTLDLRILSPSACRAAKKSLMTKSLLSFRSCLTKNLPSLLFQRSAGLGAGLRIRGNARSYPDGKSLLRYIFQRNLAD